MKNGRLAFLLAGALLAAAPPAEGQTDSSIALGLSFGVTDPLDGQADTSARPGILLRLRGSAGLGSTIGFHWFSSAVRNTIAGQEVPLGRVTVRPVMFGPEYVWESGRLSVAASLQAGVAFTKIRDTGRAKQAYEGGAGLTGVGLGVSNAFAWCPNLSAWVDLGPRFAVMASLGYLGVRPTLTTTSSAGTMREKLDLGSVVTSVGIVYALF